VVAREEPGEHPHPVQPHDLHLPVGPGEPLADDRVPGDAALAGQDQQPVELGLEADRHGGSGLAPLVAEQGHRHRPAVVDAPDTSSLGVVASV
jgi:hypothetical protein